MSRRAPVPPFTAEHERLRLQMRAFVAERLRPHADEWEQARWFPNEAFRWVADAGYLGLGFEDPVAAAVWVEELARCGSGGVAAGLGAHAGIALPPIARFGSEDQRRRYLTPGLRGELIAALAITEPDAGSDVAAIRTRAQRVDGGFRVNGAKTYITGGVRADILVTAVKTTEAGGHHGISFLIVERGPGVASSPLRKLGWHASDTRELSFRSCTVPEGNLLGERGRGFRQFMEILDGGRISVASMGVGLAQGAYDLAVAYAKERHQFGKPIASFQAIQFQLADMATEIEAGRQLVYRAAWLKDAGKPFALAAAQAKLYTGILSNRVVNSALQIHGGYGFMEEFAISRLYRDQKILEIGEGTNEVQRMVIARHLGL